MVRTRVFETRDGGSSPPSSARNKTIGYANRGMAQSGRVRESESRGCEFKSHFPDRELDIEESSNGQGKSL